MSPFLRLKKGDPDKMDYMNAAYFTIVSFSTIGYGDVFPQRTVSHDFFIT
jgi:hypothetical protein